jgi:CHAD domain-containing protein
MAALRAYDTIVPTASIPQLHALRIEFKKLRYTLEYFQEVLGSEIKQVIGEIKRMQDHLGDLQDADVACIMLSQFLEQWDRSQGDQPLSERLNPLPIVTYLANRHGERHNLATSFPQVWIDFNNPDLQHNLAMSIAVL